jgi:heme exporter protein B
VVAWRLVQTPRAPSLLQTTLAILWKDLTIELRTREIVTTAGFFAALVTIMASVAFYAGEDTAKRIGPGAIWLPIAFASVLALGRSWQRERDESALTALLVAPISRAGLFLGKAAGIFVFVLAVECIVVPLVGLMFHVELPEVLPGIVPLLLLGTLGIAATGTLFGAMTVRTRARDLVLATVLFPLLSPTLVAGISGTREVFQGYENADLRSYFVLLGIFDAVAVLGGVAMFGALLDD